jgi:polyhydroxyalkanoate synthesis repressor PhaR
MDESPLRPRTIKRYANRKLYDLEESRYITLDEIAEMVRTGEDVRIVDNRSKEDLTTVTLAQIIYEAGKRESRSVPLGPLKSIIQSGGELLTRHVTDPVHTLRAEAERAVSGWREEVEAAVNRVMAVEREAAEQVRTGLREWFEDRQRTIDEAQRRLDDRIRIALSALPQVKALQNEVEELRERVRALEGEEAPGGEQSPEGKPPKSKEK